MSHLLCSGSLGLSRLASPRLGSARLTWPSRPLLLPLSLFTRYFSSSAARTTPTTWWSRSRAACCASFILPPASSFFVSFAKATRRRVYLRSIYLYSSFSRHIRRHARHLFCLCSLPFLSLCIFASSSFLHERMLRGFDLSTCSTFPRSSCCFIFHEKLFASSFLILFVLPLPLPRASRLLSPFSCPRADDAVERHPLASFPLLSFIPPILVTLSFASSSHVSPSLVSSACNVNTSKSSEVLGCAKCVRR